MHRSKKLTKEDTWKPADLRRHLREEEHGDDYLRRRDETERRHRGGESTEGRHRDPEKESRRDRDRQRERESTRERREDIEKDRYAERRKEGSRDRRGDKERERLIDANKHSSDSRDNRDRRRDKEETHGRERDKERERVRDKERHGEGDREKRREDREKEKRREERDREHRSHRERRKHEESVEGARDRGEKHDRDWAEKHDRDRAEKHYRDRHRERDRHKDEYEVMRDDKERPKRERHEDRKHSELKEDRAYKEEHRKHKEDRERRHRERGYHDEKRKQDSESRERQASKGSGEEVRQHKERRHREDEDHNRKHRDRTESKKLVSDKSHDTNTKKTEVVDDDHLAEQEYEDDFEKMDYEEDFEELDESTNEGEEKKEDKEEEEDPGYPEMGEAMEELTPQRREEIKAIRRAMDEENERIETAHPRQTMSREEEDKPKWSRGSEKNQSRSSQRGKFINFVAAKQREVSKKVATKQKKRSTELLRLIDLDFSTTFSLLDLPPVNEYDMYIRNFGTANTKQAYVQCHEDNAERDIQTDEIEVCEKWTQHPPEHNGACGDPNLSHEGQDKTSEMNFDSQRLTAFLRSASQVMVVLLEEDQAERKSLRKPATQTDMLSFSDGSLQLNTKLPFLYGRQISLVHFSQVQRHTMMSVHKPTTEPSAVRLDSCTLICIWNIWEPSRPQKILVYESEVQCCCFSPGKATLVFAGTSVGSVLLWDLREHASNHYRLKIGDEEWTFRQPTFSTDAVMAGSGHFSSVTSVEVVPSAIAGGLRPEVLLLASEEESSGLSFQLASLDESGVLNFWVVVELPKTNEAGSLTDLGLRPGGKVKLLHSSSLLTAERVAPRDAVKTGPLQTLHLKFLPTDSNHFFIGTNMGLVNHGTSHGLKAPPKFYSFQEVGIRPADVSSIQFSPFNQNFFLVGCGDGSIRLHAVSHEEPVVEWKNGTAGERVVSLQWAQTRPTVFCVLDAASYLHIWDLLKSDTKPVITERMNADRVTAMAVFGDSGQQNTYSGIALAHESGKIEMQYFAKNFTVQSSAEEEKLEKMLIEAF